MLKIATNCTFTIQKNVAFLQGQYPLKVVKDATSYYIDGFMFAPAFKANRWDGKKHLFNVRTNSMPAGLVHIVRVALLKQDRKAKIKIVRLEDDTPSIGAKGFDLIGIAFGKGRYDYQLASAQAMVTGKRGIIKIATNGGKSEVAIAVTQHLTLPTLFLVDRLELLHQTKKRFAQRLGISPKEIGLIGDGKSFVGPWITLATPASLKTLIASGKVDPTFWKVVFLDECHRASSETTYSILSVLTAPYRFGMSGTPLDRTDGADLRLIAQTGKILYEVSNKLLVERGISVPPHVEIVRIDEPKLKKGLSYAEVEKLGITENEVLNSEVVAHACKHTRNGLQVLILVDKIKHGKLLERALTGEVTRKFINGKETTDVRQQALKDFESGNIQVLLATSILDEGIDVPCIDVLILAAGGKAKIRLLQRVGRGLRTGDGKEKLLVIDFANFCHKWLRKHSLARFKTYKKEECFMISTSSEG